MFDLFKFKDLKQPNFENNTIQKQNNKKSQQLLIENIEVGFCRSCQEQKTNTIQANTSKSKR